MYRRTADLDRDDWVQRADRRLEGLQVGVVVREHAETTSTDSKTHTRIDVLLGWLEPSITLSLPGNERQFGYDAGKSGAHLSENVMQKRVVEVVIHPGARSGRGRAGDAEDAGSQGRAEGVNGAAWGVRNL